MTKPASLSRIAAVLLLLTVAACGGIIGGAPAPSSVTGRGQAVLREATYGAADEAAAPEAPASGEAAAPPPAAESIRAAGAPSARRRLVVVRGSITVEVKDLAAAAADVKKAAADLGGFVAGTSEQADAAGRKYGSVTVRCPADRYEELLGRARALGEVESQSSTGEDVTEEFYDLEARLRAKRRLEEELLALLVSARRGGIRDLLAVEREVERVRSEIETMEGRRRYLADQAALSTLEVNLREPEALVSIEPRPWAPLTEALGESLRLLFGSIGALVIFAAVSAPWAGVLALVVWGGLRLWRRRKKPVA